jgi:hypothetical protein
MKRFGMLVLVLAAALVGGLSANAQELERWVFEGLITESSPELAPAMQSGWVMSGSFLFNGLEMEEEPVESALRAGRMSGGIHDAELTVDLYYQVQFEAVQEDGLVGFDYQDDNPDKDGRDLLGWFFPMKGKLGETGWSLTWLQVWLTHPEGKMIKHLPVAISPYGIDWQVGWFRMTYENEKREVTHVDGRIEVFSPEANLEDRDSSEQWYAVAADLSEKLVERDSTILSLRTELQEVKLRVDGLRRMVDLLVGERAELREENSLLKKQADAADPAVLEKLTELEVEKSLMETELTSLTEKTSELEEALLQSELEKIFPRNRTHPAKHLLEWSELLRGNLLSCKFPRRWRLIRKWIQFPKAFQREPSPADLLAGRVRDDSVKQRGHGIKTSGECRKSGHS